MVWLRSLLLLSSSPAHPAFRNRVHFLDRQRFLRRPLPVKHMQEILDAAGWPRGPQPLFAPREFIEQDLVAWANLEMLQQIRQ